MPPTERFLPVRLLWDRHYNLARGELVTARLCRRPACTRIACIIPAKDEQDRVAATVTAARGAARVELVIVCDDGSSDATGRARRGRRGDRGLPRAQPRQGRGRRVRRQRPRRPRAARPAGPRCGTLLLLDADLGESAADCAPLIEPVVSGRAALTIAVLPAAADRRRQQAGRLRAWSWARPRRGITELTGWTPQAPLSGQRCLTRRAFELASPLAAGWGMEVGMTIDVLRAGLTVEEIDVDLHAPGHRHRPGRPAAPGQPAQGRHPGARRPRPGPAPG